MIIQYPHINIHQPFPNNNSPQEEMSKHEFGGLSETAASAATKKHLLQVGFGSSYTWGYYNFPEVGATTYNPRQLAMSCNYKAIKKGVIYNPTYNG